VENATDLVTRPKTVCHHVSWTIEAHFMLPPEKECYTYQLHSYYKCTLPLNQSLLRQPAAR
jgi:hypothetical protein